MIQRELKRPQVDVKAIEQPNYSIYAYDPNDFLVNGMLELLDQYQRLEIALKLGRGRRKKAEQGGRRRRSPFGYKVIKGSKLLMVDDRKAEIVRRLFKLKQQNPHWIFAQYAEQLNKEGYTTDQGKRFTKVQVKRIFDHEPIYQGTYSYGSIEAVGQHQAII